MRVDEVDRQVVPTILAALGAPAPKPRKDQVDVWPIELSRSSQGRSRTTDRTRRRTRRRPAPCTKGPVLPQLGGLPLGCDRSRDKGLRAPGRLSPCTRCERPGALEGG